LRFTIVAESENYYRVLHYRNSYDYKGKKKSISKRKFLRWKQGRIDDTNYSNVEEIATRTEEIELTDKERLVLNYLIKEVKANKYIVEKDVVVEGINKAEATRTVRNVKLLSSVKLQRIRLNKELKRELDIDIESYPTVICEVNI